MILYRYTDLCSFNLLLGCIPLKGYHGCIPLKGYHGCIPLKGYHGCIPLKGYHCNLRWPDLQQYLLNIYQVN